MMRLFADPRTARRQIFLSTVGALLLTGFAVPMSAEAQTAQYASKQRAAAAAGYYARARAMLVEALEEFEQGRKYARPDLVLDSEEWRLSLISLTEELNKLVDPQTRVTRDGVRFSANPRMVRRERDRLPSVSDGAQDRNTYGEERRLKQKQAERAKLYDIVESDEEPEEEQAAEEPQQPVLDEAAAREAKREAVEQVIENAVEQQQALGLDQSEEDNNADEGTETEAEGLNEGAREPSEDQQVTSAIEDAIKERLKSLEVSEQGAQDPADIEGSEDVEQPEE